ncbi:GDP-mannose 4,6-dehydratase [Acidimicrobiia bacterium]|nr:GDP-mannose 4,6-dehydratase [Acidimicrobiia bacterium]
MNILVTGCFGFIGYNFIKKISEDKNFNFNLTGIDLLNNPYSQLNKEIFLKNNNFEFYQENITNINNLNIETKEFDLVVNFAAESHVDTSIYNPDIFIESNVIGVNSLLTYCVKNNIENYIQISTDEVYGSASNNFFKEDDNLNPSSPYSASKASADMMCNSYMKTFGLKIKTIRPANNYGPYQQPEKLIPFSISNILEKNELEIYGDGSNIRHWLYVKDTVDGILKVIENGKSGEIYNIGSGVYFTNNELALMLVNKFNLNAKAIKYVKDRPGHDFKYAINYDRLASLGWEPNYKFDKALDETITWNLENKDWLSKNISQIRKNRKLRFSDSKTT